MRRTLHKLTAIALRRTSPGYLGDGGGLYLQTVAGGSRSWIFRYSLGGKRREMGLGAYPTVSLGEARNLADEKRKLVEAGRDPIAARDAERALVRLQEARGVTFKDAGERFLTDHEPTWRNPKHRQQWRNTLATYVYPVIGDLSVAAIGTPEVTKILDPIWREKPETAARVRGRIERVLDWSKARGYRQSEHNPARWRGHLAAVYPNRAKVRKVRHHAAVPIDSLPAVYARLREAEGVAALAARFAIVTAARPGEVSGACWPEIDQASARWTVPAVRMKANRDHVVPLSQEALSIIAEMAKLRVGKWIFPGRVSSRAISLTSMSNALHAAGGGKATMHGTARSTFKDWSSERTSFANEVSEMALAHVIGDKTEAAYRRGELLEKREALMAAWANFLTTPPPRGATVVPLGNRARA